MQPSHPFRRLSHIGDMPVETFVRDYWQKKPLLVRNALPNFKSPVTADELAGYAVDDDVVSRLVVENPSNNEWSVHHGPIPEESFADLPASHWSLLVQHADLLDPEINALLDAFRFIPSWRLDDIMVSYATDQGGVGPHFDYYDVFLLQAEGKRRWRIGQSCSHESPLVPGVDMRILRDFETEHDWVVEPGDLLYIPPNLAHWGQAEGECITYSIGFRAPSYAEILLDFSEEMAAITNGDMRYSDADLQVQRLAGEISLASINKLHAIISRYTDNKTALATWFGQYMTQLNPGGAQHFEEPDQQISALALETQACALSPFARCAFFEATDICLLFINGHKWHCSRKLAIMLSNYEAIEWRDLDKKDQYVLKHLADEGLMVTANE